MKWVSHLGRKWHGPLCWPLILGSHCNGRVPPSAPARPFFASGLAAMWDPGRWSGPRLVSRHLITSVCCALGKGAAGDRTWLCLDVNPSFPYLYIPLRPCLWCDHHGPFLFLLFPTFLVLVLPQITCLFLLYFHFLYTATFSVSLA